MGGRTILITGTSGLIGFHLAVALRDAGGHLKGFDLQRPADPAEAIGTCLQGNVLDLGALQAAAEDVDGIVHLAGISRLGDGYLRPRDCMFTNTIGALNVLEVARRAKSVPWVVLGSTREVQEVRVTTEHVLFQNASGVYGLSKLCSELLAERYARDYGLRVLTLRFSDVYGSTRDNMDRVLPKLAMRALRGEELVVTDSQNEHDFTYYEDTVRGTVCGSSFIETQQPGTYKVATLCTGRGTTIRELAEMLRSQTGSKSVIRTVPAAECTPFRTAMLRNDTEQARRLLSFVAQIPLETGIDRTLDAYRRVVRP